MVPSCLLDEGVAGKCRINEVSVLEKAIHGFGPTGWKLASILVERMAHVKKFLFINVGIESFEGFFTGQFPKVLSVGLAPIFLITRY